MQGNILLLILVLWPMVGALIGYLIGRKSKTGRDYFAECNGWVYTMEVRWSGWQAERKCPFIWQISAIRGCT